MSIALSLLGRFWYVLVIALLTLACYVQTHRLNATKAEYASFVAQTKAVGEAQEAKTKLQIQTDKLAKEKADAENIRTHKSLAIALNGLRSQRPDSSFVPAAPANSSRPDLICFDRPDYIRADGEFTKGARGLSDEGTAATVDLNSAKTWAQ